MFHVLVAAAGKVDQDGIVTISVGRHLDGVGQGVGAFQRRDQPLRARQQAQGVQGFGIGDGDIVRPASHLQVGVFRSHAWVVEAGGDAVRAEYLAVVVLEQEAVGAVQDSGRAVFEGGGVLARRQAAAAGFDADQGHVRVLDKGIEDADRVAAAVDAGDHGVGQAAVLLLNLSAGFAPDHALELANDLGIGVWSGGGAEQVEGGFHVGDPVAQGFVDRVLERAGAGSDGNHFRAEGVHAGDVERLAVDVLVAHVDDTVEPEHGADGGRCHAVLAGAGFGDHALFAADARQQALTQRVVDLVGAGVGQVFALQV